jgi:hypothetical protein
MVSALRTRTIIDAIRLRVSNLRANANRHEQPKPQRAADVHDHQTGEHRDDRREITAIEPALGKITGQKRGERIREQIAACRAEQAKCARRKRRRCGKDGESGHAGEQIQQLARQSES